MPFPILGAANAMPVIPITGTFDCTNPWLDGKSKALLQLHRMEGWSLKDFTCSDTFRKITVSVFIHNPGLSHKVLAPLRYVVQCNPLKRVWLDESRYSRELSVLFLHPLEPSQLQIIRECMRVGHHLLYQTPRSYVTPYLARSMVHGPSEERGPRPHSLGSHSVLHRSSRTGGTRASARPYATNRSPKSLYANSFQSNYRGTIVEPFPSPASVNRSQGSGNISQLVSPQLDSMRHSPVSPVPALGPVKPEEEGSSPDNVSTMPDSDGVPIYSLPPPRDDTPLSGFSPIDLPLFIPKPSSPVSSTQISEAAQEQVVKTEEVASLDQGFTPKDECPSEHRVAASCDLISESNFPSLSSSVPFPSSPKVILHDPTESPGSVLYDFSIKSSPHSSCPVSPRLEDGHTHEDIESPDSALYDFSIKSSPHSSHPVSPKLEDGHTLEDIDEDGIPVTMLLNLDNSIPSESPRIRDPSPCFSMSSGDDEDVDDKVLNPGEVQRWVEYQKLTMLHLGVLVQGAPDINLPLLQAADREVLGQLCLRCSLSCGICSFKGLFQLNVSPGTRLLAMIVPEPSVLDPYTMTLCTVDRPLTQQKFKVVPAAEACLLQKLCSWRLHPVSGGYWVRPPICLRSRDGTLHPIMTELSPFMMRQSGKYQYLSFIYYNIVSMFHRILHVLLSIPCQMHSTCISFMCMP